MNYGLNISRELKNIDFVDSGTEGIFRKSPNLSFLKGAK
jgi:hypothetical protein